MNQNLMIGYECNPENPSNFAVYLLEHTYKNVEKETFD